MQTPIGSVRGAGVSPAPYPSDAIVADQRRGVSPRTPLRIPAQHGPALIRACGAFLCLWGLVANSFAGEPSKIIGMYVHQHWPYNHPYAARTWTLEDWRGYADGLRQLGYNTIMIWPLLEIVPDPPTPSDRDSLAKTAAVIDMLHREMRMRVWIALCPNVGVNDAEAARQPIEKRHFFYCDVRVNPGDPAAMRKLLDRRERLFRSLAAVDAVSIIDSDPGGYPGSTNAEFVALLAAHRAMFDRLRPGIELYYWMHVGWEGYCRFYRDGRFSWGTPEEQEDVLSRLKAANPEPWGIANGLAYAEKLGIADRVISFNYGRIEGEPSFPMTNFGGDEAYLGGKSPGPRGVMGNAQTHCVQLPNTFAFARGATGQPLTDDDYVRFADDMLTGQGALIVQAWKSLAGGDPTAMRQTADQLETLPDAALKPGKLKGLLFGDARRFVTDLVLQLRARAAYGAFRAAVQDNQPLKKPFGDFLQAVSVWQRRHGYENAWAWPDMDAVLRKLDSAEINAVLNGQFTLDIAPPDDFRGTPFEFVQGILRDTETYTSRLIAAMQKSLAALPD